MDRPPRTPRRTLVAAAILLALGTVAVGASGQPSPAPTSRFKPRAPQPPPASAMPATSAAPAASTSAAPPAPPSPAALEAYKLHMEHGVKLFEDKNFDAALVEFEAAYAERRRASPLLNVALCHKARFEYPKAIATLEAALRDHADTMDEKDQKAARAAIDEMRGLLGTVLVEVVPASATVLVDGEEQPAGTAGKPLELGPGTHRFAAKAEGYAPAELTMPVASGEKDKVVRLALVPDKGYVRVDALDPAASIVLDQKQVGVGQWAGLVAPGTHVVEIVRAGQPTYAVQVLVAAGKSQDLRPGSGGVPLGQAAAPLPLEPVVPPPPPAAPPKKEPPAPPVKGPYALAIAGLFAPTAHPIGFRQPKTNAGGLGGLRLGYRINTAAAFELTGEYANTYVPSSLDADTSYTLRSWRLGLNLRLMTSGKTVRLVGTVGGGISYDSVKFALSDRVRDVVVDHKVPDHDGIQDTWAECGSKCQPASGVDPFMQGELGIELDFRNVLLGLTVHGMVQSARGIVTGSDVDIYDGSNPLVHLGGRLHAGYAFW